MIWNRKAFLFFLCSLIGVSSLMAQIAWTASPFEQKVFIENKGQYEKSLLRDREEILFSTAISGVDVFFTARGFTYKHDVLIPSSEKEKEMLEEDREKTKKSPKNNSEEEEKIPKTKRVSEFLSVEFAGSLSKPVMVGADTAPFYYTFENPGKSNHPTIKAPAFKKILYKNVYANIDIEFSFSEIESGVKYAVLVRPGGNISSVKMKYRNAENMSIDFSGNLIIQSLFGEFIDHAPKTSYEENNSLITSAFSIKDDEVSFLVSTYDTSKSIIVDPWITNPAFPGFNSGFDIHADISGNVYVYGSYAPFKLAKLNSSGVVQWIYLAVGFGLSFSDYHYGDFAFDELSGSSYLVETWTIPCRVFKINSSGIHTLTYPGDPNLNEMWRAEYNRCIGKIIIGGGGTSGNVQAAMLDTNMGNLVTTNILSTAELGHDVALLAINNTNNSCFMGIAKSAGQTAFDNTLIRCPIPNLVPLGFSVNSNHKIEETSSIGFINNQVGYLNSPGNGYNGMTVSPNWLYTYDSDSLKRWDKNSGNLISTVDVSTSAPLYGDSSQIILQWGGLDADECDNLFLGVADSVKMYNTALSLVTSFGLSDTLYDVNVGMNNKLYVCGKGFVSEINLSSNNTVVNVTSNTVCNLCNGTASVSSVSCGASPAGFNYVWMPGGQTTQTATGLCPGTYTVTVTTDCYESFTATATINAYPVYNLNNPQSLCQGSSYSINAHTYSVPGTYYDTLTTISGCDSVIITQLSVNPAYFLSDSLSFCEGTVFTFPDGTTSVSSAIHTSILATLNGCDSVITTTLTSVPVPIVSVLYSDPICFDGKGKADVSASSGTPPFAFFWSNLETGLHANNLPAGLNSVIVTDKNFCSDTLSFTIVQPQQVLVDAGPDQVFSPGESITLVASSSDSGSYSWAPANGLSCVSCAATTLTPVESLLYYVTFQNNSGCVSTDSVWIIKDSNCEDVFIPSAFSPNNDGQNDLECLLGKCIQSVHWAIYDRWGEKVFETEDPKLCWDGTYRNEPLNDGAFLFKLEVVLTSGKVIQKKGNITLLR